ncbi:hypothetical protein SASPL_122368 [Salvia splendens]|uniref:RING-type domain-containing protein n=1 Tax=Salvia splendens TaxID=180675 RepID=A0A8X8XJF1_SALSN|nr:hypothetical protein SASPL_122368 [Salvia splendens]
MVVCKCRKATKLYCFVHKVPVCGECICFPEHQICVVRTYSEWVIDGEYDWPPKCCHCQADLAEGTDPQTARLGCLHVIHSDCLVSHVKSFPPQTAPAGYVCPACSTPVCSAYENTWNVQLHTLAFLLSFSQCYGVTIREYFTSSYWIWDGISDFALLSMIISGACVLLNLIWPPKSVKDSGSRLHSKLKDAIMQTGLEKNVFGNHPVPLQGVESRSPPPAFASEPLAHTSDVKIAASTERPENLDILEIDGYGSGTSSLPNHGPDFMKNTSPTGPGATTRKGAMQVERPNSEVPYYADDEDANRKKYSRRGSFRHKFLRSLLPFWSSALPTLPVTAPPRKDASHGDDGPERRTRHHKTSRMDPRKLLLVLAIIYEHEFIYKRFLVCTGRAWRQWVFYITELHVVWVTNWAMTSHNDQPLRVSDSGYNTADEGPLLILWFL